MASGLGWRVKALLDGAGAAGVDGMGFFAM